MSPRTEIATNDRVVLAMRISDAEPERVVTLAVARFDALWQICERPLF